MRSVVSSFDELARRPFVDGVNALCWPRHLAGDFAEIARLVAPKQGMIDVELDEVRALQLSAAGHVALDAIARDVDALTALGCDPSLSCVVDYARDERGLPIATDLMSFHADRAPIEVDTWLCTYAGKSSEGLDDRDATKLVDVPAIRARLLQEYGGDDDDGFALFLREGSFDLHYRGASAFSFGVANLWRIAVDWPGARVRPCLHRAPAREPGDEPRLLLIA